MAETLQQVIKPPTTKLTPYFSGKDTEGVKTSINITTIKHPAGGGSSVVRNLESPTGYSDIYGQPVSVAPTYSPVYQGGVLMGFRSSAGQFIPREAAITPSGRYEPSQVSATGKVVPSTSPTGEQTLGRYYSTPTGGTLQVLESPKGIQYSVIGGKEQGVYQASAYEPKPIETEVPKPAGQLYEKQIDTFVAPTGQRVPVTEIYYKEGTSERVATPQEAQYFRERTKEEQAVSYTPEVYEKYKPLIKFGEKAVSTYGEIKGKAEKYFSGLEGRAPTIRGVNLVTTAKETLGFVQSEDIGKPFTSRGSINLFFPFQKAFLVGEKIGLGVESYGTQKGILRAQYLGAGLQAGAEFIPKNVLELGGYYVLGKIYKYAPKITSATFTGLGVEEFLTAQSRKEQVSGALMAVAGAAGLLSEISFKKSPISQKEISSVAEEKTAYAGKRPTRQRATIILEDEYGRQLYELDVSSGKFILPGGNIKLGETAIGAARRELKEETGLTGIKLEQTDIIKGSRETNIVFRGVVRDLDLLKLEAQRKEVTKFGFLIPKKYAGATAKKPFGEKAGILDIFKEAVRADDLYVGSRARYIERFEGLSPEKKLKIVTKYKPRLIRQFGEKAIAKLSKENLAKEAFLFKKGMTLRSLITNPVEQTFMRRGTPTFLTQRAKSFNIKDASTYVDKLFGRKPGTFVRFQREPAGRLALGSRYDIPFKELAKYTSKDLVYTSAASAPIELTGKQFEVLKSKSKRGGEGLYFSPPTTALPLTSERYIAFSYFKIEQGKGYDLGITFRKPKPTLYELKGDTGLSQTTKGLAGKEFEKVAKPPKVFKVVEKRKGFKIAGYGVRRFGIENVPTRGLTEVDIQAGLATLETMSAKERANFLREVKMQTGRDYTQVGKRYVNPYQALTKLSISEEKTIQPKQERLSYYPDLRYTRKTNILPSISKTSERGTRYFGGYVPSPVRETYKVVPREPKIISEPSKAKPLRYTEPLATYKEPSTKIIPLPTPDLHKRLKPITRTTKAYSLIIKKRGKFIPIATGLPRGKALRLLQTRLTTNIARTGKLVETGLTEEPDISFKPSERIFRTYKIRGGRRIEQPDFFIQRTQANLQTREEKTALAQAKILKRMSNYIG